MSKNQQYAERYATEAMEQMKRYGIPASVTFIGWSAFKGCTGLTTVVLPETITSIEWGAFANTPWYDNKSDGMVYIGKVVDKYKGEMPCDTSIVIKEGVVSISPWAFANCSCLISITIPGSVTSIGDSAFYDCI